MEDLQMEDALIVVFDSTDATQLRGGAEQDRLKREFYLAARVRTLDIKDFEAANKGSPTYQKDFEKAFPVEQGFNQDIDYPMLARLYERNWPLAIKDFFGVVLDEQEQDYVNAVSKNNARLAIAVSPFVDEANLTVMCSIVFTLLYHDGLTVIASPELGGIKNRLINNFQTNFYELESRYPWVANYFKLCSDGIEAKSGSIDTRRCVALKSIRAGAEHLIAGDYAPRMLTFVCGAPDVTDLGFKLILSMQHEDDARVVLSGPALRGIESESFYHVINGPCIKNPQLTPYFKAPGGWHVGSLRADSSRHVSADKLTALAAKYGGELSDEYGVFVEAMAPSAERPFLLEYSEVLPAVLKPVAHSGHIGFVATCIISDGETQSIVNICKVSGGCGLDRVVESVELVAFSPDVPLIEVANAIVAKCCYSYPNITIAIEVGGHGLVVMNAVDEALSAAGQSSVIIVPLTPTYLSNRPSTAEDKTRFHSVKAMAHVNTAIALKSGRISLGGDRDTAVQFALVPCSLGQDGLWRLMQEDEVKNTYRIGGFTIPDSYAYMQLIHFKPVAY